MDYLKLIQDILEHSADLETLIPAEEILPTHEYRFDLGLDSLALMTLAFELQEKFPQLDESAIAGWRTVEDSIKTLKNLR